MTTALKMDKAYIENNQIAAKYLQGKLSAEESAGFEEYLIDKPELLEQLELDQAFYQGFKERQPVAQQLPKQSTPWYKSCRFAYALAACASLFAITPTTLLLTEDEHVSPILYAGVDIQRLDTSRGDADKAIQIKRPASGFVHFVIPVSNANAESYNVLLSDTNNNAIFKLENVFVNEHGELHLLIDSKKISDKVHLIKLKPDDTSKSTVSHAFIFAY